jgi:hypothetical protein
LKKKVIAAGSLVLAVPGAMRTTARMVSGMCAAVVASGFGVRSVAGAAVIGAATALAYAAQTKKYYPPRYYGWAIVW